MSKHAPQFTVIANWIKVPEFLCLPEVVDVAVDSEDYVYLFSRLPHIVSIFDRDGNYVRSWGQGLITMAHGMFIDADDHVYLTDMGSHTVRKFTREGEILMTLGEPFAPSDTGIRFGATPVQRSAGPFNMPSHTFVAPSCDIFVTDGYGNARVHRFSPQGELQASWGEPGSGPGQFNVPHGAAMDSQGLLYVADRENSRIQVFTQGGEYVKEWGFPNRPNNIFIDKDDLVYITEIGFRASLDASPHYRSMLEPPPGHDIYAGVSICNTAGEVLARLGLGDEVEPGNILMPHGISLDPRGNLYISETPIISGAYQVYAPRRMLTVQKFERVG